MCLRKEEQASLDAASSTFVPGPELFYKAFPFHIVLDEGLYVVQLGSAMRRMVSGLSVGVDVTQHLQVL